MKVMKEEPNRPNISLQNQDKHRRIRTLSLRSVLDPHNAFASVLDA